MEIPEGAYHKLSERFHGTAWTLLHVWTTEEALLAVVATAADDAFDEQADEFDVDSVELHMVTLFDTLQEGWTLAPDAAMRLDEVFEELVDAFYDRDEDDDEDDDENDADGAGGRGADGGGAA